MYYKILLFLCFVTPFISCNFNKDISTEEMEDIVDWAIVEKYYKDNMDQTIALLQRLDTVKIHSQQNKELFRRLRISYKNTEAYAAYLNPEAGKRINGPALPIYKEDSGKILESIGFQRLEELIYEEDCSVTELSKNIKINIGILNRLKGDMGYYKLNSQRFFVAFHEQLFRLVSLSMSGFDTPISQLSIDEVATSLKGIEYVYKNSIQTIIRSKNGKLDKEFLQNLYKAIEFINNKKDVNSFDRYTYIRDYLNPIMRNWVTMRKESDLWDGKLFSPFNYDAPTFFENDAFNVNYFISYSNQNPSKELIALGEKLFSDQTLSENGKMSCVSCHDPKKAFTDGFSKSLDNTGKPLDRNAPTLVNSIFQRAFFWDGRSEFLEDQISSVLLSDREMNAGTHQFSSKILKDKTYKKMFTDAFGKIPESNIELVKALSSYVSTLNSFNSKFDKNIRGEENTITTSEKNGFNLFAGKALCATCHFIPLTNGTVPPFFNESEKEVIGVPSKSDNKKLDNDLGFYIVFKEDLHKGMFKTPTLRNVALTAPYMHNGVYNNLEEVMDFYNKGGGAGLGFDLPHQTLPFDKLNLSDQEIKDLIAFMKTLTDNY
ncbi:cytochrome-c peroxidase [Flavobacterium sp.]|uniref:cytochrome-c peroxidase n=1 Tax=Flavobacterium sp. TaxID=239 RepID=UPI003C557233